jgi:hypothetical protein
MNYKKISVLVPTRKRLQFLAEMLKSFNETVDNPDQAEIVFWCDSDDTETIEYLCKTFHKIIIGSRNEGYKSLPSFYNDMARIAKGDLLMCCNDDVQFKTKGWPTIILQEANKYPDGIFNFGVNVGLNDDKFPFSIVSKKLLDILGFINDERLLFSDIFLLDLTKHFNRAIRINSVTIFHDWAGHGKDETRIDANKHEFAIVFKDKEGNWTDSYRVLHDSVVNEAINKIKKHGDVFPDLIINSLSNYKPSSIKRPTTIFPPRNTCNSWNDKTASNTIYYSKKEIKELLKIILNQSLNNGEILLSNYKNKLPSILWSNVFDKVISIFQCSLPNDPIHDGKNIIFFGSLGDTKFLYRVMTSVSNLKAILFDEVYYSHIISPYFLFKRLIKPPGIIVFMNSGNKKPEHFGVHRFINDLRNSFLDNRIHRIIDLDPDTNGFGISYEIVSEEAKDS